MTLQNVIDEHSKLIKTTFNGRSYHAIQHIIRSIDYVFPLYHSSPTATENEVAEVREFFSFGWVNLLKHFYFDIDVNVHEPFTLMTESSTGWAYTNILHSGKIEFCRQLLAYEKAGLIKITHPKENEFTFTYLHKQTGVERFDVNSFKFYKEQVVERIIRDKKERNPFDEERIKSELKKIIRSPDGKLISYTTTPEIDEYYYKQGYYQILRMQGYDDFDEEDRFGSIPYKKYVDIIQLVVGVGLKHLDACLELKKMNDAVNLHDILTYTFFKDTTISEFAIFSGFTNEEVEQVFSCITLTKENFEYYLEYPATPPPMYFQISDNILIRSIAGCLSNPFSLLNRELKRRYKSDYDKALNNREKRFRQELFTFFPEDRIIKIPREINISFRGMRTDIDAVAFDIKTGTLGLFQLKWQDPFAKSMTERFSRISNLFPKANEWISKMRFWIFNNSYRTVINSLQIDKYYKGKMPINEICVFVISRNSINFTGIEKDETVAWSSWYQLIEAEARVRTTFDDPIRKMFIKIKNLDPKYRPQHEKNGLEDLEIKLGETKIYYKN